MSQDFKPLFEYFDDKFSELKSDISRLEQKADKIQTSVDGFSASYKKTDEGLLAQTHRVDPGTIRYGASKLETWAKPVGEKLQMPLIQ